MVYIICGVSGSGKSTVGKLMAARTGLPFYDADDFHSVSNKQKMQKGIPLNDHDREDWLNTLRKNLQEWHTDTGAVLACSALKPTHRKLLSSSGKIPIRWIALEGEKDLILARLKQRKDHFFHPELLDSQLKIYSRPNDAWTFDVALTPDAIVSQIVHRLEQE